MQIKMTKKAWNEIGRKAGWIKEARIYNVKYSPFMTSTEIKKETIKVKPSRVPEGLTEQEYVKNLLDKREKSDVLIHNIIPVGEIVTKKGPSQKDLQRARGEKIRKEREKRQQAKQREEYMQKVKEQYNLPKDISPEIQEILLEMADADEQGQDLDFIELLKSRQRVASRNSSK